MRNIVSFVRDRIQSVGLSLEEKTVRELKKLGHSSEPVSEGTLNMLTERTYEELQQALLVLRRDEDCVESCPCRVKALLGKVGFFDTLDSQLSQGSEAEILQALNLLPWLKEDRCVERVFRLLADHRENIRFEAAAVLIAYQKREIAERAVKNLVKEGPFLPARLAQILEGYGKVAEELLHLHRNDPVLDQTMIDEILALLNDETAT